MLCRHIIAAIHFNSNLQRDVKKKADGSEQIVVVYPKFKNGKATVRNVKVKPSFDYVEEIYQTMVTIIKSDEPQNAIQEIRDMTPSPMNTMLNKQNKDDAIKKHQKRKSMTNEDVPSTTPETAPTAESRQTRARRRIPCCSVCKNPMNSHKNVLDCPKKRLFNQCNIR